MSEVTELAEMLEYWKDTIERNASATTPKELAETIIAQFIHKPDALRPRKELKLISDEEINQANKKAVDQQGFHELSPIEQYKVETRAIAQAQLEADRRE